MPMSSNSQIASYEDLADTPEGSATRSHVVVLLLGVLGYVTFDDRADESGRRAGEYDRTCLTSG